MLHFSLCNSNFPLLSDQLLQNCSKIFRKENVTRFTEREVYNNTLNCTPFLPEIGETGCNVKCSKLLQRSFKI